MSAEFISIQKILKANVTAEAMAAAKKFVPGAIKIYGVGMPLLNELAMKFKTGGFGLVKELWQSGAFEEKILAAKMLRKIAKKNPMQSLETVKYFAEGICNWAVCDAIGMQSLQPIRTTHKQEIFTMAAELSKPQNLWKRRLSLVLVEWYTRDKSTHDEINRLISSLENDKEYYVRKAVEWIKRNLRKEK